MSGRFFVLNSGRAGSKTIAKLLSQSPACRCLHEPEPRLVAEATQYRYGELAHEDAVDLLRRTRSEDRDVLRGETNNKLALLVPALREAFPGARYVWLVRDGRDTVASMVQRGWYHEREDEPGASEWQRWRPRGDRLGVDPDEWASWGQLERVAWAWTWVNRLIERDLRGLADVVTRVRVEELGSELPRLATFLGLPAFSATLDRANRRATDASAADNRTNVVERVERWMSWDGDQRAAFQRHAGDLMDELYPWWRDDDGWHPTPQEVAATDSIVVGTPVSAHDPVGEDLASALAPLRADIAEVQLLRGDVRQLAERYASLAQQVDRERERADRASMAVADLEGRVALLVDQLATARGELVEAERRAARSAIDAAEHERTVEELVQLRQRLGDADRAATEAGRASKAAEADADEARAALERARRDAARSAKRVVALEQSTSFRVGHALVRGVREPREAARKTAHRAVRAANRRLSHDQRATLLDGAESVLPDRAMRGVRRVIADAKPSAASANEVVVPAGEDVKRRPPAPGAPLLTDDVLLWVVLGGETVDMPTLVRRVEEIATIRADHTPFVITDTDAATLLRAHGILFELLPPANSWSGHRPDIAWHDVVARRLAQVRAELQPWHVIELVDGGVDLERLMAMLPPLAPA